MTMLIACLDSDPARQNHVRQIIEKERWDKIFLISDAKGALSGEYIIADSAAPISEIAEKIEKSLRGRITGLEVGINLVCGSGKLHMATLSAVLKLGMGIRLVVATKNGVEII